ncbi:MAG: histidinol phosphate aminotransferase [Desulfobacula sp. RIFOXYA12_FULL_46_16]|nr:MAG: histidinol phosphate aminotransferase [Desulfobacula sp. RIFOXYA12_FULL_46_16]OGR40668.1 MAG: histidinol phosphate aminotransferase [Desulfobacula sp. RIFOXYB2_FULL_45_6]
MITGHGGNKRKLAEKLGCALEEIIDMSSNLNPLGPPEIIESFICENVMKIRSLPEPDAASMRAGFARCHGMDENRVVAGNGTTWFIYILPFALGSKKALIAGPTYSDYRDACFMYHTDVEHCLATPENGFQPKADAISRLAAKADTVFLCNPDNPTGALMSKDKIEYLLKKHQSTLFIVDESYLPFVENAEDLSFVSETGYENLIVLSSMSKIYRIPGLRTGFLTGDPKIVEKIMAFYQPWSVNALAQAVIEHIFDHPEAIEPFFKKTRAYIRAERQKFMESLRGVSGLELFDSTTCFILARLKDGLSSGEFCERIGQHRVLIRDCSNFMGLSDQYVRFSLKKRDANEHLSALVRKALGHE